MNIFVGNLLFEATDADLENLFRGFGKVVSAVIVMQKDKKKSRGFGFVEMSDDEEAKSAIASLDGKEFMGRPLNVSPARPKTDEERETEQKKRLEAKLNAKAQIRDRKDQAQKNAWLEEGLKRKGGYKGGRRTHSFMRRVAGVSRQQPKPWERPSKLTMPGEKTRRQQKPWRKAGARAKVWQKRADAPKPWQKSADSPKPWQKSAGLPTPWQKAHEAPSVHPKSQGYSRPLHKSRPHRAEKKGAYVSHEKKSQRAH